MSNIILTNPPKMYLIRSQLAGVHIGQLVEHDMATKHVVLENGHRIWYWSGGNTLTELALRGSSMSVGTRISERAPGRQVIGDVFEALEVTDPKVIENLCTPRWL